MAHLLQTQQQFLRYWFRTFITLLAYYIFKFIIVVITLFASSFNAARRSVYIGRMQDAPEVSPQIVRIPRRSRLRSPAIALSLPPLCPSCRLVPLALCYFFIFFCSSYLSTHQPQSVFFLGPQRGRGVSSNRKLWKAATPIWHLALSRSHCRRARRNEGKKFLTFEWNVPTVVGHFLLETFHRHSSFLLSDSLTSVYSPLCKQRGNGFTWKTFNSSQNPFLFFPF